MNRYRGNVVFKFGWSERHSVCNEGNNALNKMQCFVTCLPTSHNRQGMSTISSRHAGIGFSLPLAAGSSDTWQIDRIPGRCRRVSWTSCFTFTWLFFSPISSFGISEASENCSREKLNENKKKIQRILAFLTTPADSYFVHITWDCRQYWKFESKKITWQTHPK